MKECFLCHKDLEKALLYNIEVDYCPDCHGIWIEEDELRLAKDRKDENLKWLDIDLWDDEKKFKISKGNKLCPVHRLPLYEVEYGDSKIKVDVCSICHGIWLDRGEFKQIIDYLKEKANWEILNNYYRNLGKEALEVFIGPESVRQEVEDLLIILKLFNYKFLTQRPTIAGIISKMPK